MVGEEVVAWAVYGRVTGRIRRVETDEPDPETYEFYDVVPLVKQPVDIRTPST